MKAVVRQRNSLRQVAVVFSGEYIEDTEEYINIELDSSRNRLIRLEIILTAGTFALAIFTLVGGDLASYSPPSSYITTFVMMHLDCVLCFGLVCDFMPSIKCFFCT